MAVEDKDNSASALPLLAGNVWRTSNVILSRCLGRAPRYLPVILLFVTERCNLRCRSCGVCDLARLSETRDSLSTEQWKAVITAAATRLGTSLVSISGGEPLLRKDIFDIIRFAADAGMSVHICTNAVLIDTEKAARLRDAGVSTVSISLESPNPSVHDYLRGNDTFHAVVDAIRLLKQIAPKVRIGINFLITRYNYREMASMASFAASLGAHQLKFAPIHTNLLHRHKAKDQYGDLLFREEDLEDLEREIKRARQACAENSILTNSDAFFAGIVQLYRSGEVDYDPSLRDRKKETDTAGAAAPLFQCYAGYAVCAVSPTGDVSPCCDMDSEFNVTKQPLDVIWRDPAFHALRKKVRHCNVACWDTTNTELSLRLRPRALISDMARNWRDLRFYFGKR